MALKILPYLSHEWDVTPSEAISIQNNLKTYVRVEKLMTPIKLVAGTDVSYDKYSDQHTAVVVVLSYPELKLVDFSWARHKVAFPYVPGLLSFREIPALLLAFASLKSVPDVILCDGQGMAHPRRMGIASHLGVLLNWPTVGVGKSRLCGSFEMPLNSKGSRSLLTHKGEIVGNVLRTRENVAPVFVSVGHKITLEEATSLVLTCLTKYRLPETTRQAHRIANEIRVRKEPYEDSLGLAFL